MGETFVYRKKYHIHNSLKKLAHVRQPRTQTGIRLTNTKHQLLAPSPASSDKLVGYLHEEYPRADGSKGRIVRIKPYSLQPDAPALVYFHGGGFRFSAAPHHYRLARQYALECGCQVLMVDYRLLPDDSYPVPAEDAYAAWKWVSENAHVLLLDSKRIAIGGDGAGGCLAVSCMLRARDEGAAMPCFQMVLSPILNQLMTGNSYTYHGDAPVWSKADSQWMWNAYLYSPNIRDIAYASPAHTNDFSGLPPAYVELVTNSSVYSDAANYWGQLDSLKSPAELYEARDAVHGFDSVADSPVTQEAVARRIAALKKAFFGE